MSLTAFAIRLIGSRLLVGQTWAEDRIVNSPVDPLAQWNQSATDGTMKPTIAIYSGDRQLLVGGKQSQGGVPRLDLVFDIVMPAIRVDVGGGIQLETSQSGGAAANDFVARQVDAALRFGPEPWLELWNIFVVGIAEVRSRNLLMELDQGVQAALMEVTYTLNTLPDPGFGIPLFGGWQKLVTAMEADAAVAPLAPLVSSMITEPAGLPAWRQIQAFLGASDPAIRNSGLAPQDSTETGEAAVLSDIDLTPDVPGSV